MLILLSGRHNVFSDTEVPYGILVTRDISSVFSKLVEKDLNTTYNLGGVENFLTAGYSLMSLVTQDTLSRFDLSLHKPYSELGSLFSLSVSSDTEVVHNINEYLYNDLNSNYHIFTYAVSDTEVLLDLSTVTKLTTDLLSIYTLIDPTSEVNSTNVIITVDGEVINVDSINMTIDDTSYCWTLSAQISDIASWVICAPGKSLIVTLDTDYVFTIDQRDNSMSFNENTFSLSARSPTSVYGEGAEPIHDTWDATATSIVVSELIDTPHEFNIGSWNLSEGLLVSEGDTPIAIVKRVAEARGGIVYTKADGTLVIEKKYKIDPPNYDINTYEHSVSDLDDIVSISEARIVTSGYNQVEVSDEPDSDNASISISLKENSLDYKALTATLIIRAYPFIPLVTLLTSHNNVTLPTSDTPLYEDIEEILEIIDGVGSTSQPIYNIVSSNYQDTDLGNISINGNSLTTEIPGVSLLNIIYTTQYHEVYVTAQDPEQVQVYKGE